METKEYLSKIVPTVKDLLSVQGKDKESEILQIGNIIYNVESDPYGNEYYYLIIEVQTDKYVAFKKQYGKIENLEKLLYTAFCESTKGDQPINGVTIRPNSNVQATLFESGSYQGWRNGYFRMFISHITSKKKQATSLKKALEEYGITSFVAHEDIKPSKEWLKEIEKALNSMDCMSAMMYDGFHESKWCDQEVGIALGRSITVLPLLLDDDPYGFLGEYQGIKIKGMYPGGVSKEIFKILCDNPNTRSKYLPCLTNLLLSANNKTDALKWLSLIEEVPNTDSEFWRNIQSHVNDNEVLLDTELLNRLNSQFSDKGISVITKEIPTNYDASDLPF